MAGVAVGHATTSVSNVVHQFYACGKISTCCLVFGQPFIVVSLYVILFRFVGFRDEHSAQNAVRQLHGKKLRRRPIIVEEAYKAKARK